MKTNKDTNNDIWYEELPEFCPPLKAIAPQSEKFYRVAKGDPTQNSDFFSQRKLQPDKQFNVDECIARAISIFKDTEDALRLSLLPKFKGGVIAEIILTERDGLIMKTFKNSHYSWWRTKQFDYKNTRIIHL